jgi:hypothetical protein
MFEDESHLVFEIRLMHLVLISITVEFREVERM